MYYGILSSLDVVCHFLPVTGSIYRFVPPVIHLAILTVIDGGSDAHLRPLL